MHQAGNKKNEKEGEALTLVDYLWFFVFPFVGVVMLIVTPVLFWLLWFRYLNPTARKLNKYIRKKIPIVAITFDTGRTILCGLIERRGEGVVMTDHGTYKILPRIPEEDEETKKGSAEEDFFKDLVLKRSILEGSNSPFFVGYSGKICMLNPDTLALAEMTEHKPLSEDEVTLESPEPASDPKKARPLLLIDPKRIKDFVSGAFSESQMIAIIRDTEEVMRASMGFRRFAIPITVIVVIMLMMMIAMQMFGGGGMKPA